MGAGREVRPRDEPNRIVDFHPPAAVDDRSIQRQHPSDMAFGAPVEALFAPGRSGTSEGGPAECDTADRERRKDQRLVLPGKPGISPSDHRHAERCGGEPDAHHRRHGDLDYGEDSAKHRPIPEGHYPRAPALLKHRISICGTMATMRLSAALSQDSTMPRPR